jgi:hypothetical protein
VDIDTQRPLRDAAGKRVGRVDLVIGDALAFELKRGMRSASEGDRAVGQVWKYLDAWTSGPVVLLLCETYEDFDQSMTARHVVELSSRGKPAFIVAAGKRLR